MKKLIKRIPFIGHIAKKIYRKIKGIPEFTTSGEYWEKRYKLGGNSGAGSYNNLAEFKGEIINRFLENKKIESVIEFGCGDGNQLKHFKPKKYLGYDISEKAVIICTEMYKNDSTKSFKSMNNYNNEIAELTMSLDVIYHLIEDYNFTNYMNTLFQASSRYVIVYSSNTNENKSNAPHVKHRRFTEWVEKNQKSFYLSEHIPNKYPFDGDGSRTSMADFFIYNRSSINNA
jgi:SAM-dependent methyltransferase